MPSAKFITLAGTSALTLSTTSTAAASNAQKMLNISLNGVNSTSAQTTYGAYISNTHTGTTSTNVGLYATASGGGFVTLLLQDVGGFEGGKQLGQIASKNMSFTSISGVGDDAYYLAVGDQVGLIVKKGNAAFKVAVYAHISVESKEAKEKTLAQQVVAGL